MAVLPDNSSFGNNLVINGSAETRTETPSWRYAQKIVPQGLNARQPGDAFGTMFDQDGNTLVVGTPNHSYDQDGLNTLASAGSIWVYTRALAPATRPTLANAVTKRVFTFTGSGQNFVVPAGVRRIRAKLWGAGGGGTFSWTRGGNGGYTEGEFEVEPGETLTIMVGQGGSATIGPYVVPYPNGGYRTTNAGSNGYNGSGGGRSAIRRNNATAENEIITAGAGGGGGVHSAGGHAGGLTGTNAANFNASYLGGCGANLAGPISSTPNAFTPGGGYGQNNYGTGGKFSGGYAQVWQNYNYHGAGGDGYYGGSAGVDGPAIGTGGGGGCGFTGNCLNAKLGTSTDTMIYGSWDADYVEGIAAGGGIGTGTTNQGGHGMVVLSYTDDSVIMDDTYVWPQQARIVPTGTNARISGDQFGSKVAVNGSWIAAGTSLHGWDADGTNETAAAGAVFMFNLINGTWTQTQKVLATGINARNTSDQFGYSVALENDVLVVGAPYHDFNEIGSGRVNDAGAVFVYKLVSGTWTLFQKIVSTDPSGRNELDAFGSVVRINNGRIVIQAPGNPTDANGANSINQAGAVYVYDLNAQGKWALSAKLVASTRQANANYGSSLDVKGNTIIAGCTLGGLTDMYNLVGATWVRTGARSEPTVSTTQVLMHFNSDQAGIYDSTQTLAAQPTITGTVAYDTTRSRFGTGSLSVVGSPITVNLGSRGALNPTGDWTTEFYVDMQEPFSNPGMNMANQNGPLGYFSYTLIQSTGWNISVVRPAYEFTAGTLTLNITSYGSITLGQVDFEGWQHIALVRRGGNIMAYRNGSLMGQLYVGTGSVALGGNVTFGDGNFKGLFNEFRICSEAKYLTDFTPPYHPFRQTEGTALGRGGSVTLLDSNTALVGLPRASGVDTNTKVTHDESYSAWIQDLQARHNEGGLVETLSRSGTLWTSTVNVAASGNTNSREAGSQFGTSVVIKDGVLAISAPYHSKSFYNHDSMLGAGAVFTYTLSDHTVTKGRKLLPTDRNIQDGRFGLGLDIQAGQLVVSSPYYLRNRSRFYDTNSSSNRADYDYQRGVYYNYTFSYTNRYTQYAWQVGRINQFTLGSNGVWQSSKFYNYLNGVDTNVYTYTNTANNVVYNCSSCFYGPSYVYSFLPTSSMPNANKNYPLIGEVINLNANSSLALMSNPALVSAVTGYPSMAGGAVRTQSVVTTANSLISVPGSSTSTRVANQNFGKAVATDGTRIAVGAPNSSFDALGVNSITGAGAAYVFAVTPDKVWGLDQQILSSNRSISDNFGQRLDMNTSGVIIQSNSRTELFARIGTPASPWTSRRAISSYTGSDTSGNKIIPAAVNTQTFAIGVPMRNTSTYNLTAVGDAMLLRMDPKRTTVTGSVQQSTTAFAGSNSAQFTGLDGSISIAKSTEWKFASSAFTVEFFVKTTATSGTLFNYSSGTNNSRATLSIVNGKLTVFYRSNNSQSGTVNINDNQWHHVAWSWSGGLSTVYLDGALATSFTVGYAGESAIDSPTIGGAFIGFIDDFRIYMGVNKYPAAFTAPTTALPVGAADPLWDNLEVALNFNNDFKDGGTSWWIDETQFSGYQAPGAVNGRTAGDLFGQSIALGNNLLAVGAPGYRYRSGGVYGNYNNVGTVFTYSYSNETAEWTPQGQLPEGGTISSSTRTGDFVSIEGNYVAAGTNSYNGGIVKVWYQSSPGNFVYQYENQPGNFSGVPVLLNDEVLVFGLPNYTATVSASGAFSTITRVNSTWTTNGTTVVPLHTNGRLEYNAISYTALDAASNGRNTNDNFGAAVSINTQGDLLAIGAPGHDYNVQSTSVGGDNGAVFVYYWDTVTKKWRYQTKVSGQTVSSGVANQRLGQRVQMRDGYLATSGSPATNGNGAFVGLYYKSGTGVTGSFNWQSNIATGQASDRWGSDVTLLSNSFAVSGASYYSSTNFVNQGAFRSIARSDTTWTAGAYNVITGLGYGRNASDLFGRSLALQGTTLLVGSPNHSFTANGTQVSSNSGAVFVYEYNASKSAFAYSQRLNPDSNVASAQVGLNNINFRGDTAVVNGNGARFAVLSRVGGSWTATPSVTGTVLQGRGISVVDDSNIIVGLPTNASADPSMLGVSVFSQQGAWRLYSKVNGTWTLGALNLTPSVNYQGYEVLAPATRIANANFGTRVSLSNDKQWLAVSMPGMTTNDQYNGVGQENGNGGVFVYAWNGSKFAYHSLILNPGLGMMNTSTDNTFGFNVDVKDDRLLITAGTTTAGSYYVYRLQGDTWVMEKQNRSQMGSSLGISAATFVGDSSMLALGAPTHRNYPQVVDSGRVISQKRVGSEWVSLDQREGGWGQNNTTQGLSTANPGAGGGGGGGAQGGSGGGLPFAGNYIAGEGGLGGTNMVPAGGNSYAGILNQAPLNSDPDRGTAGDGGARSAGTTNANSPIIPAGAQAASGSNGRVVLSWNGGKQVFDFTGADQFFTVPADVTTLDIKMWGAGGGGGINLSGTGGAGGAVTGTISVTPTEILTVVVGQGGLGGIAWNGNQFRYDPTDFRYGGAGRGATPETQGAYTGGTGANGGGRSELLRNNTSLAIAGGGGGSGSQYGTRGYGQPLSNVAAWGSTRCNGQPGGASISGYTRRRQYNSGSSDLNVAGNIQGRFAGDQFGQSVALDAYNNVLIGVPYHQYDAFGDNPITGRGSVFVFQRDRVRKTSTYTGRFSSGTAVTNNYFGHHMQVLGSRILVGSGDPTISNTALNSPVLGGGGNNRGAAEVFTYDSVKRAWSTETRLTSTTDATLAMYKSTLVNDSLMVRGIPQNNGNGVPSVGTISNAGGYETVTRNGSTWSYQSRAVAAGLGFGRFASDYFGSTVKLGGDWLAVGARNHRYNESGLVSRYDNNGSVGWGAMFIFKLDRNTNNWVYETKLNSTDVNFNFATGGGNLFLIDNTLYSTSYCGNWSGGSLRNWVTSWTRNNGVWSAPVAGLYNNANTSLYNTASKLPLAAMDANTFVIGKYDISAGLNGQPTIPQAGGVHSFNPANGFVNGQSVSGTFGAPLLTVPGSSNGRASGDRFGTSVFAGASYVVVGAPNQSYTEIGNSLPNGNSGALYVYSQPGGGFGSDWRLERKINGAQSLTGFGTAITGSGNYVLAEYTNTGSTSKLYADQVQRVNPGTWSTSNKFAVTISSATTNTANSGSFSMAGTPDMVTVGKSNANGTDIGKPTISNGGLVDTYTRSGGVWTARATIAAPGASNARLSGDNFGYSVAVSRNNLIVGAPFHGYDADGANNVTASGAVYVFTRNNNTYNYVNKFVAASGDRATSARYGSSVSIDDLNSYVAVGTRNNLAFVYGFDGATFRQMGRFTGLTGDNFGYSVSVNGGRLAVGAYTATGVDVGLTASAGSGLVYMYRLDQSLTTWNLVEKNYVANPRGANNHGFAVAVSANGAAIMGSPGGNTSGDVSIKYIP